jgi:hypothetical protein
MEMRLSSNMMSRNEAAILYAGIISVLYVMYGNK